MKIPNFVYDPEQVLAAAIALGALIGLIILCFL
jgi:uncharacterized membrane protein